MRLTLPHAPETGPTVEPVTLSEALDHLRISGSDSDAVVEAAIVAAREQVETEAGCALVTQEWIGYLDRFPCGAVELPLPPVQSVEAVNYYDAAGVEQVLSPTLYVTDLVSWPARILPAYGTVWPVTEVGRPNAVSIEFTTGFGDDASDVPRKLRAAVLLLVGELYESREAASERPRSEVPLSVKNLCADFRARAGRF